MIATASAITAMSTKPLTDGVARREGGNDAWRWKGPGIVCDAEGALQARAGPPTGDC